MAFFGKKADEFCFTDVLFPYTLERLRSPSPCVLKAVGKLVKREIPHPSLDLPVSNPELRSPTY